MGLNKRTIKVERLHRTRQMATLTLSSIRYCLLQLLMVSIVNCLQNILGNYYPIVHKNMSFSLDNEVKNVRF